MNIAIIGSGISSLSTAHLLSKKHRVTVFEKDSRIGGHTATIDVDYEGEQHKVDTGFIVFNERTYPNFIKLMAQLGVKSKPTTMGFSYCDKGKGLEYSGTNLNTLFAQRSNLLKPSHWGMIRDILRFNKLALADLNNGDLGPAVSLDQYLKQYRLGDSFRDHFLVPMASAIWSTGMEEMLQVPALFFIRFFKNHGLLSINDRPQWRVIEGGSASYLEPLVEPFKDRIFVDQHIEEVLRDEKGVTLDFANGERQRFDQIVFGCHSDQALALLGDASAEEQAVLSAMPYCDNKVVLHTDASLLPKRKSTWSSWNYLMLGHSATKASLTYHMNILQGLESKHNFLVTLNTDQIAAEKIIAEFNYAHPVFSAESLNAQQQWPLINGARHTWFCGAYWHNGFHEDGLVSALKVAEQFGIDLDTEREALGEVLAVEL